MSGTNARPRQPYGSIRRKQTSQLMVGND